MKKVLAIALSAVMVLSLAACGNSTTAETKTSDAAVASEEKTGDVEETKEEAKQETAGEAVSISWYAQETDNLPREKYMAVIDAFEKEYPNINVELELYNTNSEDLMTKIAAGTLPDVLEVKTLAAVEGVLAEAPEELTSKFAKDDLMEAFGAIRGVPRSAQGQFCVIYHKDAFEELGLEEPKTYADFLKVCDTFVENGIAPMQGYGASNANFFGNCWALWNLGNWGKATYDNFNKALKTGECKFTDERIIELLKEFQTWNSNGYYAEGISSTDYSNAVAAFQEGSAPMMIDGVWSLTGLDENEYGIFFMPDTLDSKYTNMAYGYYGVSDSCKNKDAAWTFIDWMLTGNGLPVYTEQIYKSDSIVSRFPGAPSYEMEPLVAELYAGYENERIPYNTFCSVTGEDALPAGFDSYLFDQIARIFFENADVEEVMEETQKEFETFLAEQG